MGRSNRAAAALYLCRFLLLDRHFWWSCRTADAHGHFSKHQHSGRQRSVDLQRLAAQRYVGPRDLLLRAHADRAGRDIEHIESQSLSGYGVVKIFFQKNVNISAALAQVTAASQTVLKLLPPGITPPYVLSYNAATVPILQLALSSKQLPQMKLFDLGQNFIRPQLATVAGAAVPSPYGGKILQAQVDLDQQAMQAHNVSADDVVNAIRPRI